MRRAGPPTSRSLADLHIMSPTQKDKREGHTLALASILWLVSYG